MRKWLLLFLLITIVQQVFCQWNNDPSINNVVANSSLDESNPFCVSDGANGSIVIFESSSDTTGTNIYAQKITAGGGIAWGNTANPVAICNAINEQYFDDAISDGAGGAYIAWEDYRSNTDFGEIYVQHINSSGVALWPSNGIRVTNTNSHDDYEAALCSDGSGGFIVTWSWDNYVTNAQVSAQRYNSAGIAQWTANGIQVCLAQGFRAGNKIVSDGVSGAIIFFLDTRDDPNGTDYSYLSDNDLKNVNIYAQKINSNGQLQWGNNGAAVCTASGNQDIFGNGLNNAIPDGNGGAIIAFNDGRNDVPDMNNDPTNYDVFAQKINNNGSVAWTANGIAVAAGTGNQYLETTVSDGNGGIVLAWNDETADVSYSQRISNGAGLLWNANGVALSTSSSTSSKIINDGAGNFIYGLLQYSTDTTSIAAQNLNASGSLEWGNNGVIISNNILYSLSMIASDNGAAILVWNANKNTSVSGGDIFASKILSSGILAGTSLSGYISAANGNWNEGSTWLGGLVPPASAQVTVKHNVIVTANATCDSLSVVLPGSITIETGINLTITH